MTDLFSGQEAPLADRMRPRTLAEFIGQRHLLGEGRLLRRAIEADRLTSSIFFGPPGCGKTTLASIIANSTKSAFVQLNAVTSGVVDVRKVIADAQERRAYGQSTYLLLDECHRWSKAQSDSILPAIERGIIRFIGSTTENPMVSMTPAIVSRCRVFQFEPLTERDVLTAMRRAIDDPERGYGQMNIIADDDALRHIARIAGGDTRAALGAVELAVLTTPADAQGIIHITLAVAEESIQKPMIRCDESLYYDMLSAFCKSLRGSDSDAALAWFARLIYAGVDPKLIAADYCPCQRRCWAGEPDCDAASGSRGARGGIRWNAGSTPAARTGDYRHLRKSEEQQRVRRGRCGDGGRGKGRLRRCARPPARHALRRARPNRQRRRLQVSARLSRTLRPPELYARGIAGEKVLFPIGHGA